MKKIKTCAVAIMVLCTAMAASFTTLAEKAPADSGDAAQKRMERRMENQTSALEGFHKLKSRLGKQEQFKNYGGSYINDDGNLTVLICDKSKFALKRTRGNVQSEISEAQTAPYDEVLTDDTEYKASRFTLEQLEEVFDHISGNKKKYDINTLTISETNNIVRVGTKTTTDEDLILKDLNENVPGFDADSVEFEQEEEFKFLSTSYPGRRVYTLTSGDGTSGFNAKDKATGKYGVVTAGHGVAKGQGLYNKNGTLLGNATIRQVSKKIDAAFVPYNSGMNPAAGLDGDTKDVIGSYVKVADIVEGMNINRLGSTSGRDGGKILEVNKEAVVEGISFTGLVFISTISAPGDSGGPVIVPFVGPVFPDEIRRNPLIGIVTAGNNTGTLVTKAGYILVTFGLDLYTK